MSEGDKSLDILGLKPYGEAVNTLTKGAVEGTGALLGRICLPAAEEFGLLLKDKISNWRKDNAVSITEKLERNLRKLPEHEKLHAHPRILTLGLENASWAEADEVREMWAGLLTSSCTSDGKDDSNLVFINILNQLTTSEIKVLNFVAQNSNKYLIEHNLLISIPLSIEMKKLKEVMEISDVHRIDRELDHLRSLDLFDGGIEANVVFEKPNGQNSQEVVETMRSDTILSPAKIIITGLGLNLYVRCQGYLESPATYFDVKPMRVPTLETILGSVIQEE